MAKEKAEKAASESTDPFQRRLATAVWAGWCTVLIWFAVMTFSWVIWLVFLHIKPDCVRFMWGGGDLKWATMQRMVLWFFGVFKMLLFAFLVVVMFLSFWLRRLKQA